ncbi:MAG: hypothetical protein MUP17_05135 [candidate division Zixibacteria bacterium]|nr:hypothetical protein [candidate division Zixibacteria bacterium]
MDIKRIGTIKEHTDGTLDIRYWIVDDCELPSITDIEVRELIKAAKANGTYTKE